VTEWGLLHHVHEQLGDIDVRLVDLALAADERCDRIEARIERLERILDRTVRALQPRTDTRLGEPRIAVDSQGDPLDLVGQDDGG
jgi:hypothetical protein